MAFQLTSVFILLCLKICVTVTRSIEKDGNHVILPQDFGKGGNHVTSLKVLPHRIHLSGDEIVKGFSELRTGNSLTMKFTYELVEPSACDLLKPTFGCCWDNKTIAHGPNGEGCPVCKDEMKKSCHKWIEYCHVPTIRQVCPGTCNACPKKTSKCQDAKDQKEYCPLYKRFGLCRREQIRMYCKNTCGACTINDVKE